MLSIYDHSAVDQQRFPAEQTRFQRVAIVHYWLVNMRGGERLIEAFCELYPGADLFTASHAKSFSKARFKKAFREFVETAGPQRGDSVELTRSFEPVQETPNHRVRSSSRSGLFGLESPFGTLPRRMTEWPFEARS